MIEISVANESGETSPNPDAVIQLLTSVFVEATVKAAEINLIFTDDDYLSELKKQFFDLDQFTDVIAFRMNDYSEESVEGEIYISLPRARENAAEFGEPYGREVGRLIIHGGLHLLGYDDQTEDEKAEMRANEEKFLGEFEWNNLFLDDDSQ